MTDAPAPLAGVVVADFSRILAGPLLTMILGDLGADVIKVERPATGDDTRSWGPPWAGDDSTYYLGLNRNKRSVVLDLRDSGDLRLARRLAGRADVLVENFRPGLMEELELGYDDVAAANPGVVYCTISGFGTTGAGRALPGYDFLVQAMSGLMSITGEPDGPPLKVGVAVIDELAGLYAAIGVLAALQDRHASGRGRKIEVSLFEAALAGLANQASAYLGAGVVPRRLGNRHPSIAPYQLFATADRPIAIAVGNDQLFGRLCAALGSPDLAADGRFATNALRVEHVEALTEKIEQRLTTDTAETWIGRLRAAGIPSGPVHDVAEAFGFADELGLDAVLEVPRSGRTAHRSVRSPIRLDGLDPNLLLPPPGLGEHSEAIRAWLEAGD